MFVWWCSQLSVTLALPKFFDLKVQSASDFSVSAIKINVIYFVLLSTFRNFALRKERLFSMMIHPLHTRLLPPERMNNPFRYSAHPLCQLAVKGVLELLSRNSGEEAWIAFCHFCNDNGK